MNDLEEFDRKCLLKSIEAAKETMSNGNYPVGAVLCIDNEVVDIAGNEINKNKSFVNHAENSLIIRNGEKLYIASEAGKSIAMYSTLEPCLQCLGACVANNVKKIFYIQKDPNGGACDVRHDNIGSRYNEFWPEIVHASISEEPRKMMIEFFQSEIKKGNIEWPTKMLGFFGEV